MEFAKEQLAWTIEEIDALADEVGISRKTLREYGSADASWALYEHAWKVPNAPSLMSMPDMQEVKANRDELWRQVPREIDPAIVQSLSMACYLVSMAQRALYGEGNVDDLATTLCEAARSVGQANMLTHARRDPATGSAMQLAMHDRVLTLAKRMLSEQNRRNASGPRQSRIEWTERAVRLFFDGGFTSVAGAAPRIAAAIGKTPTTVDKALRAHPKVKAYLAAKRDGRLVSSQKRASG